MANTGGSDQPTGISGGDGSRGFRDIRPVSYRSGSQAFGLDSLILMVYARIPFRVEAG